MAKRKRTLTSNVGVVDGVLRDPKAYFFSLIGKNEGDGPITSADLKAIGQRLIDAGMPQNVGANRLPKRTDPYHGIAIMTDGGGARGRLFLPARDPQIDENGNRWFTRDVQFIEDWPGATPGVGPFRLSWREWGSPFVPVQEIDPDSSAPPVTPPPSPTTPDIERRMQELEASVDRKMREFSANAEGFMHEAREFMKAAINRDDLRAIVSEHLSRVRVEIDVKPAGPIVKIFGQRIDLNHDHEVEASLLLDGARVQHFRKAALVNTEAIVHDPKPTKK